MAAAPPSDAAVGNALPAPVEALLALGASRIAILVDFDGTLSPIVDDPASARPDPAARAALEALAPHVALAACITGRPALQARELLGLPGITYSGLHGAELLLPGADAPIVPDAFAADADAVAAVVAEAEAEPAGLAGLTVERKGPIVALHWRRSADPTAAQARAEELAQRAEARGLRTGVGRAVLELRPGLEITKGDAAQALLGRAPEARGALFAGDDVTDLDAFAAVAAMRSDGRLDAAALIAVGGHDAPPAVADAGDVVVPEPAALGALLQQLADRIVGA